MAGVIAAVKKQALQVSTARRVIEVILKNPFSDIFTRI
jgi:hypothetical protein